VIVDLGQLTPAAFEGWQVVFELDACCGDQWVLVGGQMVALHAASLGVRDGIRPTDDVDVLVDVRARRDVTAKLGTWLIERGFSHAGMTPDGVGHRYRRPAVTGGGTVIVDVLAPEGLGGRASLITTPPARTVAVPGGTQALARAERVTVAVADMTGDQRASGTARRPDLLGAIVAKAAATTIPVRDNPTRDWQDAALLLAHVPDPYETAERTTVKDRRRLAALAELENRSHSGWDRLSDEDHRRGTVALQVLLRG
jgi:hypothetical protein